VPIPLFETRMSTPENPGQSKTADAPNLVPADAAGLSFEQTLHNFWKQYGRLVVAGCVVVLLAILGQGVLDYMAAQKEAEVRRAYAAANTPEKLKAFAAAQSGHLLAGVASLQLADEAYAAGRGAEAVGLYESVAKLLADTPLAGRVKLGRAMALLQAGRTAEAETALQELADLATASVAFRAEAAYHLATRAQTAGRTEQVRKLSDQIMQMDPSSPWAQRALLLGAGQSLPSAPDAAADEPAAGPVIKLNLPGGN
jgi:hypothetical protein